MSAAERMLIAVGVDPRRATDWAPKIEAAAAAFGIDTPRALAMFIAQISHESANLRVLEEDLTYTQPERIRAVFGPRRFPTTADAARFVCRPSALANFVYASRNGNGDEASGDGWRFRGRGPIQLTGRGNYAEAEAALGESLEAEPERATLPAVGAAIAAWFFAKAGCVEPARDGGTERVTRLINGPALAGLEDRRARFERAMRAAGEA